MIYGILNTSQQIIVNSNNYVPTDNEVLMKYERPSIEHIALKDGTWSIPSPSLEEIKANKIAEFKSLRDKEEIEPIEYNNNLYDYDSKAQSRINVAYQVLQTGNIDSIAWTTADNKSVNMTANDFAGLLAMVALRSNNLHVKYRELKEKVLACESNKEVEEIIWERDSE